MTTLRTLKSLLLGETWILPCGLAAIVAAAALVVRPLLGDAWRHAGGFVLLAAVIALLLIATGRTARPRRAGAPPAP